VTGAAPSAARLDGAIRVFDRVVRAVLSVAFAGILVAAVAQVASRYIPGVSLLGSEEVARYLMVATAFLAIPMLTFGRQQIAVDALAHYLPTGWPKLWLQRVILLVEIVFYTVFANYSYFVYADYAATGQSSTSLGIPLAVPALTVMLGAALGVVATLVLLVRTFLSSDDYRRGSTLVEADAARDDEQGAR